MWREADAPDGRKYYYHTETQQTTWEKPADFDAPNTVAPPVSAQPQNAVRSEWKSAQAADGRTYYYNSVTNVTQWEQPEGFAENDNSSHAPANDRQFDRRDTYRDQGLPSKPVQDAGRAGNAMPWERRNDGFSGPAPVRSDEPLYQSPEEAEAAFFGLLRAHEIKWDAAWPDVIRKVGRERGFRAFKDPGERREEFDKYCREERAAEAGRDQERKKKRQEDFLNMLRLHDEIKYYTRWKTAVLSLEREIPFKNISNDDERKQIFAQHKVDLQKKHIQEESDQRQRALEELRSLMSVLVPSSSVKWHEARDALAENERFAKERLFRTLSKIDVLRIFEDHVRRLDHERNDHKQQQKALHYRRERQARDAFRELLSQDVKSGHIRAATTWQEYHRRVADDERYKDLLGLPGSSPLDLFWDAVDSQEQQLRAAREDALDVLDAQRYEMLPSTTFEEFAAVMARDGRTERIPPVDLKHIFSRIMEKVKRRHRDQQAIVERGQQDAVDDFRSALRHLDPPIHVDDKYDDIAARLGAIPASRVLSEDAQRSAFDRHIRRLKDKAHDRDSDRRRDRDKDHRSNGSRRSHDHDRDRDRRHRTRTRSPEIDAYEADRRKAQADRERQYRKASFGLTPPPRERRDPRSERDSRRADTYESVYERERKEREVERERSYISRADPRDKGKISALDYGDDDVAVDSTSSSVHKRRGSDGSAASKRDSKRLRRGKQTEDEPALQSGSEEGEIEEV